MGNTRRGGVDVLVVGAGMYVCGRGTDGFGTVLPALLAARKHGLVNDIRIAATSRESVRGALEKGREVAARMGVDAAMKVFPQTEKPDTKAYMAALEGFPRHGCAIVSVPDHLHFEIARDLIERGVHVLVVKPLVPTVREARELIRLKNEHSVYALVEFHKRYDEANLKLYELIRSGALGRLLDVRVTYSQRKSVPTRMFQQWVGRTNVFQYLGIHYVDLIGFLTGARPARVMSYGRKKWLRDLGIDTYDTIATQIEWQYPPDGERFLSSHFTGWIDPEMSPAMSDQRIELVGTRGRCLSDQRNRGFSFVSDGGLEEINPYFTQIYPDMDGKTNTVRGYGPRSIEQFLMDVAEIAAGRVCLSELGGLRPTFETSLYPTAVLEASARSLENDSAWITIKEIMGG